MLANNTARNPNGKAARAANPDGVATVDVANHIFKSKKLDDKDRHLRRSIDYKFVQVLTAGTNGQGSAFKQGRELPSFGSSINKIALKLGLR